MDIHGQSWAGRVLKGRYRVEAALRAGGMGAVYRAVDLDMAERPVVVKHPLRPVGGEHSDAQEKELRKRFAAEVAKLIDLSDIPGVVRITDQGVEDGTPFYVMDFMAGGSLHDRLQARRDAPQDVLRWAQEVAATLDEIHARGLVHRDVKPQNLLFQRDGGRALIGDFGIVKELTAEWGTTGPANTQIGTPGFMALEQLRPDMVVDGRCDQYALAATMYVALTGKPLTYETTGGSPAQTPGRGTGRKALRAVNAPDMAPHLPSAAAAAVTRGLEPDRDARFDTCAALVEAYEAGLEPAAMGTRTVQRSGGALSRDPVAAVEPGRRSRALPLLALLVLVGGGGFFGLKALGVVGGGRGGERADAAPGPVTPTAPVAGPAAPTKPSEPPPKEPEKPAPTPAAPTPAPAYEAPLARAKAALAEGDGAKAKTALAEAVAADAPKRSTAEVEAFVAAWEAAPVLAISAPTSDAEIEAGTDGRWQIAVKGTLQTGRKGDRLFLEDREIARDAAGAFAFTTARSAAGPVTLTLEVRDGTTLRASGSVSVRLKATPPPPPPTPPTPSLPTWATPLLSQAQKDEAQRLKVEAAFEDERTGVRYVLIPGGTFTMGAPESEKDRSTDEGPTHSVTLPAYYLAVTETTNAQFERFVTATGYRTAAEKEGKGYAINPETGTWEETAGVSWRAPLFGGKQQTQWASHPVVLVSWDDAKAYQAWAQAMLPSEAQFERALRGGRGNEKYPWGPAETPPAQFGNYLGQEFKRAFPKTPFEVVSLGYDDGFAGTAPVASFAVNGFGLHDISGNVWEWCEDDYHSAYTGAPSDGSSWIDSPRAGSRVLRGGGWISSLRALRSAYRSVNEPSYRAGALGFRLARAVTAR